MSSGVEAEQGRRKGFCGDGCRFGEFGKGATTEQDSQTRRGGEDSHDHVGLCWKGILSGGTVSVTALRKEGAGLEATPRLQERCRERVPTGHLRSSTRSFSRTLGSPRDSCSRCSFLAGPLWAGGSSPLTACLLSSASSGQDSGRAGRSRTPVLKLAVLPWEGRSTALRS